MVTASRNGKSNGKLDMVSQKIIACSSYYNYGMTLSKKDKVALLKSVSTGKTSLQDLKSVEPWNLSRLSTEELLLLERILQSTQHRQATELEQECFNHYHGESINRDGDVTSTQLMTKRVTEWYTRLNVTK
jgi:hypothetical protein